MTTESLYLLCAGGHAKVVLAAAEAAGYPIAGLFDDEKRGESVLGYPVLGSLDAFTALGAVNAVICLGDNAGRLALARRWPQARWVSIVHPSAVVHRSAVIGAGSVVLAGAVINPDVRMGEHCIVNTGSRVEHDCFLGRGVHIATGAALGGRVRIGEEALVGTGASVRPDIRVGDRAIVGVGAAVVKNVPAGVTVVGVPARSLR